MTRSVPGIVAGLTIMAAMLPCCAWASSLSDPLPAGQTIAAVPLDGASAGGALVMQAHAQALLPAPLPDRDLSAPGPSQDSLAGQADPSLTPGFFNPSAHFAGDGYASGSSIENDHNHRHSTGGLMSLSIPMP